MAMPSCRQDLAAGKDCITRALVRRIREYEHFQWSFSPSRDGTQHGGRVEGRMKPRRL